MSNTRDKDVLVQQLRESEERYRALYEDNPSMYFTVDAQGTVLSVNRFGAEQLGYTAEELIGQSVLNVFYPDDKAAVQQQLAACLQHLEQVAHWEFRKVRKDGSMLWVKESARTVRQADGQPMVLIVCEDITERKHAEQQLQWRTEDLALINTINEAINRGASLLQVTQLLALQTQRIFSSNGTHLYLLDPNKQWLTMLALGLPPKVTQQIASLIGMPIPPVSLPVQALTLYRLVLEQKRSLCSNDPKVIQGLIAEFATGIPLPGTARPLLSPLVGAIYSTLGIRGVIVVPLLAKNEPIGILDMSRTEPFSEDDLQRIETIAAQLTVAISRKRTEEALRNSEDRYRDLVEASPVVIILHDLQGQVISANPAAAQLLGYTTDEIAHMNVRDCLAPQVRDQFEIYLATVQQNGYADGLMRVQTRAGKTRILEFASTLRTEGVTTPIVRAMARDVTELKRAERAQRHLARQMSALHDTSLEISAQTDLAQLLPTIIHRAADLVGASIGALYLMQSDNQTLKLIASHNMPGDYAGVTLRLGEGISGRVAQAGDPLMVEDYRQWTGRAAVFADAPFRRLLGVPLKSGNRVIGVLNFTDVDKTGAYQEDEIRLACLFADQAAIAIENARLFAQAKQRADEFAALYETTRDLATQWHLPTLLETIALRAIKLLHASGGGVLLRDQARNDLELAVAKGSPTSADKHFNLTEEIAGRVAQTRQPIIVNKYHLNFSRESLTNSY